MSALERAVAPLDRARAEVYRALSPWLAPLLTSRERRVAVVGALAVVTSLALTLGAPLVLLVWAPLVLGVPHLLADVRYLVARPGLHRRGPLLVGVGLPLAAVGAIGDVRVGLLATLGAVVVARAPVARRVAAGLGVAAVLVLVDGARGTAELWLLHLHNLVAGVMWWTWRPNRPPAHAAVAVGAVGVWVALAGGALDGWVWGGGPGVRGVDVSAMAHEVAPWATPSAYHLLLAWIFAQSLHYAVWLRLVPEDDRARRTPRPFAASARALLADVGPWVLGGAGVAWVGVLAWGLVDPEAARAAYLRGALFHGHLELAILALAWTEGRRPGEAALPTAVAR